MKPIHPFPARMAPELVSGWVEEFLPKISTVLDPMCGSGVVLRQAAESGHNVIGFDIDPLAVLMSRVWMSKVSTARLVKEAGLVVKSAARRRVDWEEHSTFVDCKETRDFAKYWFAKSQRTQLTRLCRALGERAEDVPRSVYEALQLCVSRTIITKQAGASLAWDVSHSRPHKVSTRNDFDVFEGFLRAAERLAALLAGEKLPGKATVGRADCRRLAGVNASSIDAVITSPPYLNALDYLRGHKLALIWLGYTIPELRTLRSTSIGTERVSSAAFGKEFSRAQLDNIVPEMIRLPVRQQNIVLKYAQDASVFLSEMKRVVKPGGHLVLVLADSLVRQVEIPSSRIFGVLAENAGFRKYRTQVREIPASRRYLPIGAIGTATGGRMRTELVQAFSRR